MQFRKLVDKETKSFLPITCKEMIILWVQQVLTRDRNLFFLYTPIPSAQSTVEHFY